ncbi:ankyrin repeat domain-containing protein [Dyadobacter sp. OTU695]|uniref:ankyrin repeat domain-containing protein n=1 Tax=Dyadobacter sp. OTU695 TaxID=3043860 RepID=UPI00313A8E88
MAGQRVVTTAMLDAAVKAGDEIELSSLLDNFPHPEQLPDLYRDNGYQPGNLAESNARQIICCHHCFDTWQEYAAFRAELSEANSRSVYFEAAAGAIANGDIDILRGLLAAFPEMVHMRSPRNHHSTLLNYVGANGIESWRQQTPYNAAKIAQLLLEAGAEVDAWGDMYRGTSTLGLVATSVHPVITGVQQELMDVLIRHGADPDHAVAPDYTEGMLILACIHNGRYEPIHYLARHGARVDFEGACALGDLQKAQLLFANASPEKHAMGLIWSCQYDHREVAAFLLGQGIPINIYINGTTPLLAAAYEGQLQMVKILLERGADMEVTNDYGGTALGQTLWCLSHHRRSAHMQIMELLIAKGAIIHQDWLASINELRKQAQP